MDRKEAAIEAILFASGEPVSENQLGKALDFSPEELKNILDKMQAEYDREKRGICLIRMEDRWQLCTRPIYASDIRKVLESGKPPSLSQAALEVLTVVAYHQPVTRAYIDQVRGVDSSYTVSTLLEKDLIIQEGHLDVPGHPSLLKTTEAFLRLFCFSDLSELPTLPEFTDFLEEEPPGGEL